MLTFLQTIFRDSLSPERRIAIFTMPSRQTRLFSDYEQLAAYAREQSPTQDVYFGVGLITGNPQGRGKLTDIAGIGALWCDIDCASEAHPKANLPKTIEEALALLAEMPLAPTIVVHSGHGIHAYWCFKEPWIFANEQERQRAARLAKGWHALVCRKAASHGWQLENLGDLTRIMRLPGTLNHKGVPIETRIQIL